jgi:hypothetical protein
MYIQLRSLTFLKEIALGYQFGGGVTSVFTYGPLENDGTDALVSYSITTDSSSPTASPTASPTTPTTPTNTDTGGGGGGGGLSMSDKISLGVGLGVGLPSILLAYLAYRVSKQQEGFNRGAMMHALGLSNR